MRGRLLEPATVSAWLLQPACAKEGTAGLGISVARNWAIWYAENARPHSWHSEAISNRIGCVESSRDTAPRYQRPHLPSRRLAGDVREIGETLPNDRIGSGKSLRAEGSSNQTNVRDLSANENPSHDGVNIVLETFRQLQWNVGSVRSTTYPTVPRPI